MILVDDAREPVALRHEQVEELVLGVDGPSRDPLFGEKLRVPADRREGILDVMGHLRRHPPERRVRERPLARGSVVRHDEPRGDERTERDDRGQHGDDGRSRPSEAEDRDLGEDDDERDGDGVDRREEGQALEDTHTQGSASEHERAHDEAERVRRPARDDEVGHVGDGGDERATEHEPRPRRLLGRRASHVTRDEDDGVHGDHGERGGHRDVPEVAAHEEDRERTEVDGTEGERQT